MNYLHNYHAGSSADVFKHLVLFEILQYLKQKDKAFFYLDTHAGEPIYDLSRKSIQKSAEYQQGIAQLFAATDLAANLTPYFNLIKHFNKNQLRYYPGSFLISKQLLRPGDRLSAADTNPIVIQKLKDYFANDKQVQILQEDGYLSLNKLLPPKERRGLVLIDPPYERNDEFKIILQKLTAAYQRWETGIYAIWYPIKQQRIIENFHQQLINSPIKNILCVEFCPLPADVAQRLSGSGMIIINPPWQLDTTLEKTLSELLELLRLDKGGYYKVEWLKN